MKSRIRNIQPNSIAAFLMTFCLFVIASLFFDFYYDLNDDVLIKDIVSGAYSGSPDGHSIQMLWPVSWIISLLYRLIPVFPWQGIILCICHGVCFYLIAKRSLVFAEKNLSKVVLLLTEAALILALFLWELVMVQYTITAALLAACACFWVITSEKKQDWKAFMKAQTVPILLVILAFNIRSEMLLLMSPFIALTGILKWSEEEKVFATETLKKYLGMVGIILAGMVLSFLADAIAYAGEDWKEFRDFFDARTQVYDYTWYPEYEEAEAFYREMGVTPAKVTLIDNYNFGLDESIDADLLWSIADYAEETGVKKPLTLRLKEAITDYKWRTFHDQDAPYNYFVLTAYVMVVALAILAGDKTAFWKLPLMWVLRTIPWMYVILAKRVPARISHPLYYIELIILCGWMFSYCKKLKDKRAGVVCTILLCAFALIRLPNAWQDVSAEMERREEVNGVMVEFDAYAKNHPGNYFYMDVYSTVDFSEKMFESVDNAQKNYDILGGWASGSPLQKQATANYHKDMLSRAELLLQENFYYVCEDGSDTEFLKEFYSGHGAIVDLAETDKIGKNGKPLVVYKIEVTATKWE